MEEPTKEAPRAGAHLIVIVATSVSLICASLSLVTAWVFRGALSPVPQACVELRQRANAAMHEAWEIVLRDVPGALSGDAAVYIDHAYFDDGCGRIQNREPGMICSDATVQRAKAGNALIARANSEMDGIEQDNLDMLASLGGTIVAESAGKLTKALNRLEMASPDVSRIAEKDFAILKNTKLARDEFILACDKASPH